MMRSVASKVMWVGRATVFFVGLAVILALVFGVASRALGANGQPWLLGKANNSATRLTALVSEIADPNQAALQVRNAGEGPALELRVGEPGASPANKTVAPMKVNSQANVANLNSDLLDGEHSSAFQPSYERTVVVSPVGSPQQNGTALLEALGGIEDASESNPYLIKIEPGVYDLGTQSLQMKPHVDIEGSGELATTITSSVNDCERGVVVGANDAEIRFLNVDHNNPSGCATGIYVLDASPRITSVSITVLDEAGFRVGVWNEASSPVMTDVRISVTGPNGIGVHNRGDSSPTIRDSIIETQIGIFNQFPNGDPTVTVDGSRIEGTAITIQSTAGSTVRVGASQLAGGNVSSGGGTVTCAGVYDENYVFSASTCP